MKSFLIKHYLSILCILLLLLYIAIQEPWMLAALLAGCLYTVGKSVIDIINDK